MGQNVVDVMTQALDIVVKQGYQQTQHAYPVEAYIATKAQPEADEDGAYIYEPQRALSFPVFTDSLFKVEGDKVHFFTFVPYNDSSRVEDLEVFGVFAPSDIVKGCKKTEVEFGQVIKLSYFLENIGTESVADFFAGLKREDFLPRPSGQKLENG